MAADTAAKRLSAMNDGCVWRGVAVVPSGASSAAERRAAFYYYGGDFTPAPPVVVPAGSNVLYGEGTPPFSRLPRRWRPIYFPFAGEPALVG